MDTTDPEIVFDSQGVCNHCHAYRQRARMELLEPEERQASLQRLVECIKEDGRGKKYDCILGISGGADSSYAAYVTRSLGLHPLAVHFDNGWNSELAVDNIKTLLSKLEIDLFTYVVDWNEFCDLQKSFLMASVPNAEIPTDHGINAVLWDTASKYNLRYIINGSNIETEAIMPLAWTYTAMDYYHIRAIHRRFGSKDLKTFPKLGLFKFLYYVFFRGIRFVNLLNYISYDKAQAVEVLRNEFGWRPYHQKHHESVWTRFYQGVYLVEKFGFDKRRPHYSTMINSGQLNREQALELLQAEIFHPELVVQDREFVLKKFEMQAEYYEGLLELPPKQHLDYPNLHWIYMRSSRLLDLFKRTVKSI
ncbi:MAG: N-acetyl sugar amidotransferase [Anaerolineales bacterium]|nr:N-acetyl sugar amidotransferase [Anaerolineales bacterium]